MAFKILTSEELELLTENQRKSYDEELAVYKERVQFVEQVERFENIVITPYEAKFAAIPDISRAPEEKFVEPEYVLVKFVPGIKPDPKVTAVHFGRPAMAVVPKYAKTKNVSVGYIKKMERGRPVLPIISKFSVPANIIAKNEQQAPVLPTKAKVSIPSNTFKKSEQASPILPTAEKPQNFSGLLFKPVTIDSSVAMVKFPKRVTPTMGIPAFAVPEYGITKLPSPKVELPKASVLGTPELTPPVLPEVIVSKQMDVSWKAYDLNKQVGKMAAKLPQMPDMDSENILFCKPDIQKPKLPIVSKAEILTKKSMKSEKGFVFAVPEHPTLALYKPEVEIPTARVSKVHERTVSDLPTAMISKQMIKASFRKPNLRKIELPTIQKSTFQAIVKLPGSTKQYDKMPVNNIPKIERPLMGVFSVKPLRSIHGTASGLPIIPAVDSPDIYAKELLEILLPSQKENGPGKETLHEK